MKTTFYTFYESTIIENIDFDGYEGLINDVSLYDKIKTTYNIFKSEYVHQNNKHQNEIFLFSEWLSGLPSVLTVPFYYYEMLENATKSGFEFESESHEDKFCEHYFKNLAKAFFNLKENL